MSKSDEGYARGLMTGALIGGAFGAIAALLFAPKSGKELRKDIAEKSGEFYDKTTDYVIRMEDQIGTSVHSTVNEGKIRAQNIINSARNQAEGLLSNAEQILQDAKSKAVSTKGHVQDKINDLRDAAKASADAFKAELKSKEDHIETID